jgi:hypothetical protein
MDAKKVIIQTDGKTVPIDVRSDFMAASDERVVEIQSKPALRWAALHSLRHDIEFVSEACKTYLKLGEDGDSILRQSLWISSIVMYARCFNQSDGRRSRIDANSSLSQSSDILKARHAITLNTRNQLIAHAGVDIGEQIHVVAIKAPLPSEEIRKIGPFVTRAILPIGSDMEDLFKVCGYHLIWIDQQIEGSKTKTVEWTEQENRRTSGQRF